MIFWAHPEAEYELKTNHVTVVTKEHTRDLMNTRDYTGFCVFSEGYKLVGKPGGIWDEVLNGYVQGKRKNPVWAIAGLAYDYYGDIDKSISISRNMVMVKRIDSINVQNAIKEGSLYAVRGEKSGVFVINKFEAADKYYSNSKSMGQTLMLKGDAPLIRIDCELKDDPEAMLEIKLIRGGETVKTFRQKTPVNINYIDIDFIKQKKAFYRMEVSSKNLHAVTNPIFVEKGD